MKLNRFRFCVWQFVFGQSLQDSYESNFPSLRDEPIGSAWQSKNNVDLFGLLAKRILQ